MLQEEPLQDLLVEFLKQYKEFFVHFKPDRWIWLIARIWSVF
jgi:hypothetical protein